MKDRFKHYHSSSLWWNCLKEVESYVGVVMMIALFAVTQDHRKEDQYTLKQQNSSH